MEKSDKIRKIEQGIMIKKKLYEMGIVGFEGPQGEKDPKGDIAPLYKSSLYIKFESSI